MLSHRDVRNRFLELIAKKKSDEKRFSLFFKNELVFPCRTREGGARLGEQNADLFPPLRERGGEMEVPIKIRSNTHSLPALLVMLRNELAV